MIAQVPPRGGCFGDPSRLDQSSFILKIFKKEKKKLLTCDVSFRSFCKRTAKEVSSKS